MLSSALERALTQNPLKLAALSEHLSTTTYPSPEAGWTLLSGIHKTDEVFDLSGSIFPRTCVQELFVSQSRRSAPARQEVTQGQDGTKLILWQGGLAINQF